MRLFFIRFCKVIYKLIAKRIFFLMDPEKVHSRATHTGERLGKSRAAKSILGKAFQVRHPALSQEICSLRLESPIGLAAGFDYEARLTQILPSIGFGFGSIGTITNRPCEGNPRPRLGRLVKSKSLMVNKGFRNPGVEAVIQKFQGFTFDIPIGISIGRTNVQGNMAQEEAVEDIVLAYQAVVQSGVPFSYYELNISCPNLQGSLSFYPPANLKELLASVFSLGLKKPLFVKMPTDRSDAEVLAMLDVIADFPVQAVIFGNLQKDRTNPAIKPEELKKYPNGTFSGKPAEKRSNELIELSYKSHGDRLTIIGCGGVFSAEDAYKKIKLGASLVQLITGMIFEGPFLSAQINAELIKLLQRDGFTNISEAIGSEIV